MPLKLKVLVTDEMERASKCLKSFQSWQKSPKILAFLEVGEVLLKVTHQFFPMVCYCR